MLGRRQRHGRDRGSDPRYAPVHDHRSTTQGNGPGDGRSRSWTRVPTEHDLRSRAPRLLLNGLAVADGPGGSSRRSSRGSTISSSGPHAAPARPPVQASGSRVGENRRRSSSIVQVNAGVPGGTVISNQATVQTVGGFPTLLTDGDGNPATGPGADPGRRGQRVSSSRSRSSVDGGRRRSGARHLGGRVRRCSGYQPSPPWTPPTS